MPMFSYDKLLTLLFTQNDTNASNTVIVATTSIVTL